MKSFQTQNEAHLNKNPKYLEALKAVIDPELSIDIVNLGLIYGVEVDAKHVCTVTMTLTIIGCPLTVYLDRRIKEELMGFDEINQVKINLVWHPAWSINKMSYEARLQLRIH